MLRYMREYTLSLNTFTFEGLEIVFGFIRLMCILRCYLTMEARLECILCENRRIDI